MNKSAAVTPWRGCGLNLNVHFHTLVLDGVFSLSALGGARFHPAPPPTDAEVARADPVAEASRPWPASAAPPSRAAWRWAGERARSSSLWAGGTTATDSIARILLS